MHERDARADTARRARRNSATRAQNHCEREHIHSIQDKSIEFHCEMKCMSATRAQTQRDARAGIARRARRIIVNENTFILSKINQSNFIVK